MEAVALLPLPWNVIQKVMLCMHDSRCWVCEEGIGLLCLTADGSYQMWCLGCFTGIQEDYTAPVLIDGFQRGVHSYSACPCSFFYGDVRDPEDADSDPEDADSDHESYLHSMD